MEYKELKSLSYGNEEDYAKEYLRRFESEHAVKIGFFIGERQAFFLQNVEVMTLAYKIAKLDKTILTLCSELPGIALEQYSKKCLIDEIVLTNKIEGVNSSRKEIGEALDILEYRSEKKRGKKSRFVGLVNKYLKLIDAEKISIQSCMDIRRIYDDIFLEEIVREDASNRPDGEIFRKGSVSVYSPAGKELHNGIYPESKIIEYMDQALAFLNDESIEQLFRICLFHYFIEYIHPFYDGNGRIGRFILSYGISRTLSPIVAFRISESVKEDINSYYKAFQTCNDQRNLGDLTPFLLMQLSMICRAMSDLVSSLEERKATWKKYEKAIDIYGNGDSRLTELYSLLVQAALFSEMGISTQELERNLSCSAYFRNQLLQKIPQDLIIINKKGNRNFYSLNLNRMNEDILRKSIENMK